MRVSVFGRLGLRSTATGLRVAQLISIFVLLWAFNGLLSSIEYINDHASARRWIRTSATLREVKFSKSSDADEAQPWLVVRYEYPYQGKVYKGSRLTLAGSPLYLKPLLEDFGKQLAELLNSGANVNCYVDPDDPYRSVLNRTFFVTVLACRTGLFTLAAIVGGLLLILPTSELDRRDQAASLRALSPNEPWRWRHDWKTGTIRSASRADSALLAGGAALYLIVFLPLGLLVVREHGREILSVPGVVMLIGGWGAFNLARTRLWSLRRYDNAEFQLAGQTGVIGGLLYGSISLPKGYPEGKPWRLTVECLELEQVNTGSSKKSSRTNEHVLWRDTAKLSRTLPTSHPGTAIVPVCFAVPYDCRPSEPEGNPSIHWFLKIGPDGREGLGEYAAFEVPVFKTKDSSPNFQPDPQLMAKFEVPLRLENVIQRAGGTIVSSAGETLIRFSMFRPRQFLQAAVLFIILVTAAAVLVAGAYRLPALLPGVFALIVAFASGNVLLWRSQVRANEREIDVVSGLRGFQKRLNVTRDVPLSIELDVEYAMKERSAYLVRLTALIPDNDEPPGVDSRIPRDHGQELSGVTDEDSGMEFRPVHITLARHIASEREARMLSEWLSEKLLLKGGDGRK